MVDTDSAFMWETEALRSSPQVGYPPGHDEGSPSEGVEWVTLRQANQLTGIPVETIRKWARRDHIESYMAYSAAGERRMVSIEDVRARAEHLGRNDTAEQVDLRDEPAATDTGTHQDVQPGTMLVPIDAWDKMLLQLGNLHQAGQQLAEATARAAKAETEAKFLKERMSEMRTELSELKQRAQEPSSASPEPAPSRLTHIPIESDDDVMPTPQPEPARDVTSADPDPVDGMTLRTYSFEMAKHLYSTWRERPKR